MIYYNANPLIIRDIAVGDGNLVDASEDDFEEGGVSYYKVEYFRKETERNCQKTLVAIYDGKLAGYVNVCKPGTSYHDERWKDNSTFFYDLFVLKNYRHYGVATHLIDVTETLAKETSSEIWCFSVYSNKDAQEFYLKHGFTRADDNVYLFHRVCDFADFDDIVKQFDADYIEYKYCKQLN